MRRGEAQGLDGLMAKMTACERKGDSRLISQCVMLFPHCLHSRPLSRPLSPSHPLTLSTTLLTFHFCATPAAFSLLIFVQSLSYQPASLHTSSHPQPNALLSLNVLFLLTSCLHPSQWPCVTPGRIITLGQKIGSVAPCSALSALSIYGLSPFVVSHLPIVQ